MHVKHMWIWLLTTSYVGILIFETICKISWNPENFVHKSMNIFKAYFNTFYMIRNLNFIVSYVNIQSLMKYHRCLLCFPFSCLAFFSFIALTYLASISLLNISFFYNFFYCLQPVLTDTDFSVEESNLLFYKM
jgi:hypothetical protein